MDRWVLFSLFLFQFCYPGSSISGTSDPLDFKPPWKIAKSQDKTRIYKHPWSGHDIQTCKADTIIAAPLDKIVALILDVESYPDWIPQSKNTKILKQNQENAILYYMSMDFPWPASDRDWVNELMITSNKTNHHTTITFTARDHIFPQQKNHIRVTDHNAYWTLIPIDSKNTRSIWQWNTDPGGHLPSWLIQWASQSQVLESLNRIKEMLEK